MASSEPAIPREAAVRMASAVEPFILPHIELVCTTLSELSENQKQLLSILQGDNESLRTQPLVAEATDLMGQVAAYQAKAAQLRKDMASLDERVDRLKKRAARLTERRQRYDARAAEKERALVAVDLSGSGASAAAAAASAPAASAAASTPGALPSS
eukprot:m51a1_g8389 hypothetical protein (157) ;mRNA; r:208244-208867